MNENGEVMRNRERLVCKSYAQVGVDFEETFALVIRLEAIRMFLAFASHKAFKVYRMDVKSAFLNGDLEEVYVELLEGFTFLEKQDQVCRLRKALYGLKQAPRAWYSRLDNYLQNQGFKRGTTDSKLYIKSENDKLLIVVVYVDDIIFGGSDKMCKFFSMNMQQEFEMSMLRELSFFLGLQIEKKNKGIFISQGKYIKEMLKKFGMEDCTPFRTRMIIGCKLSKEDESPSVNQSKYRSMIGSLLYLTTTRPDILQAVTVVARLQAMPKETHVLAVKRIFKYLKGTVDLGLWYPRGKDLSLTAYTDGHFGGNIDDRSTSGGAFFLGNCLVS